MTSNGGSYRDRVCLLAGPPVVERRVQLAGVSTAILEGGQGPPLGLLHGGIAVPTSLLWGRHDRVVPLRVGEYAKHTFGWSLREIDDAAHTPHIERPEAFVRAMSESIPARPSSEAESP